MIPVHPTAVPVTKSRASLNTMSRPTLNPLTVIPALTAVLPTVVPAITAFLPPAVLLLTVRQPL